jgi:hypothetical protein
MLAVLGGLAEFEKELIKARTGTDRDRSHLWREPHHDRPTLIATLERLAAA